MCKELEKKAEFYGIPIVDFEFPSAIRSAYHNGVIGINKNIGDDAERRCIIVREMGRHLLRKNKTLSLNDEQENILAMHWAVSVLMPLSAFIEYDRFGRNSADGLVDYLNITPQFFKSGIEVYKSMLGNRILFQNCIIDLENKRIEYLKEVG